MAWETTAPGIIIQLRSQLGSCAAWSALFTTPDVSDNHVHFPSFNPGGVRGTADALPSVLLMRPQTVRRKWVEGASGLISGSLGLIFYFRAVDVSSVPGYSAGQVEALVETIVGQLIAQQTGIPFRDDATIGEASDPTDPEIAGDTSSTPAAFRTCTVTLPYGYSP